MKNILFVILFIVPAWTVLPQGGDLPNNNGSWAYASVVHEDFCPTGRLCVEWHDPGSAHDGMLCCMFPWEMYGAPLSACQRPIDLDGDGRPPGNPA